MFPEYFLVGNYHHVLGASPDGDGWEVCWKLDGKLGGGDGATVWLSSGSGSADGPVSTNEGFRDPKSSFGVRFSGGSIFSGSIGSALSGSASSSSLAFLFFLFFLPFSFLGESSQLDDVSSLGDVSSLAVVSSDDSEEPSRLAMSMPFDATLAPGLLSPQPSQNVR